MKALPASIFLNRKTPPHILTLTLLAAMSAIPMNIFVPSLPVMALDFDTKYSLMALAISLYLVFTALAQLIVGPLSDRYGRRPIALGALAFFFLATFAAMNAETYLSFMVFRCMQAAVVASTVVSRASIRDMVPREQAASLIGYVTMGMALAPMFAPSLGGFLEEAFGWRASFLTMLIASFVIFVLVYFDLGETNHTKSTSFAQQFRAYPALLRARRFWGYVIIVALCFSMFLAYLSGAAIIGASVYDLGPQQVGLYLAITPFGYMIGNGITGRFTQRIGLENMMLWGIILGTIIMLVGLAAVFIWPVQPMAFFAFTFSIGLCNGMILPCANAGMLDVRPELAGSSAGLGGALMTLSGAILGASSAFFLPNAQSAVPLIIFILVLMFLCLFAVHWTIQAERQHQMEPVG